MKLKIKALTNQNVCIDTYTYPPYSDIECELDIKHIPTYAKAFEHWEIIEPTVQETKEKVVEKELPKPQSDISIETKPKEAKANDGARKKTNRQVKV